MEMVLNPFRFWELQRKTSFPGVTFMPAHGLTYLPCIACSLCPPLSVERC